MFGHTAFLLAVLGCSGGGDSTAADAGADAGGEASFVFEIELTESRSAGADGQVAYASVYNPWSADGAWVEAVREGDCVFNEAILAGACDPPCEAPEFCHLDSTCGPPITRKSAGAITIEGLAQDLVLLPQDPYDYYTPEFDPEPADGEIFAEGSAITATADGDAVPAFAVATTGVGDLSTPLPCELTLVADQDLLLEWTPAPQGGDMRFVLQSGNHGMQFSSIVCQTSDSGSLVVSGSLIGEYLADFHPLHRWILARERQGTSQVGDIRIELRAQSAIGCQWY